MNVFTTSNAIALQLLQGAARVSTSVQMSQENQRNAVRMFGRNLLLPSSNVANQAAAKIAEIINTAAGRGDLPQPQSGSVAAAVKTYATNYAEDGRQGGIAAGQSGSGDADPWNNLTFQGGDGDDRFEAHYYATVSSGKGNDVISVYGNATIDSGEGDDTIYTYHDSKVTSGDGDDWIHTGGRSTVDSGAGNDTIKGLDHMQVTSGSGNDEVRVYDHANIDAGDGNDLVVAQGYSTIKGGAGNDVLLDSEYTADPTTIFGHSFLDGGEGDDYIQASINSTVSGGAGNDDIRLTNRGATVLFNKGDGHDMVTARESLTAKISGYSKDDLTITKNGDTSTVSFKGSDEGMTFNLVNGAVARLVFEDGSTMDVTGTDRNKSIDVVGSNPDLDPKINKQFYYSSIRETKNI
jgi:hypothetical protein